MSERWLHKAELRIHALAIMRFQWPVWRQKEDKPNVFWSYPIFYHAIRTGGTGSSPENQTQIWQFSQPYIFAHNTPDC